MDNMVGRTPLAKVLIAGVAMAMVCCASAEAKAAGHTSPPEPLNAPAHKKAPKKKTEAKITAIGEGPLHGVVPPAQVAIFASLAKPRATDVPRAIVRAFTTVGLQHLKQLGIDYTEARRLDVANARFYLIPGKRGICLFTIDGGSVCSANLASVARYGLNVNLVPPPAGPVDQTSAPGTPGPVVLLGVVPRGITAVTVTTTTGETVTADQAGEAYIGLTRAAIVSRTLTGPGLDPVTDPSLGP